MGKASCLICGRLTDQVFCADCHDEGWELTHSIQSFLRNYPGVATIEVCRELSVSLGFIKGLVEAGYLTLAIPDAKKISPDGASGFHSGKNK